jgi:hypothetical protein
VACPDGTWVLLRGPRGRAVQRGARLTLRLLLLFELADKEDERFQAAAARWYARFVLETNLPLREAEGVMTLLCRLRGADRHIVRRRLWGSPIGAEQGTSGRRGEVVRMGYWSFGGARSP